MNTAKQPTGPDAGHLLDVAGAARHLGVTEAFVRRLVLEKRIRYYKVGKFVRFRGCDLDSFINSGCVDVSSWRVTHGQRLSVRRAVPLGAGPQPPGALEQ